MELIILRLKLICNTLCSNDTSSTVKCWMVPVEIPLCLTLENAPALVVFCLGRQMHFAGQEQFLEVVGSRKGAAAVLVINELLETRNQFCRNYYSFGAFNKRECGVMSEEVAPRQPCKTVSLSCKDRLALRWSCIFSYFVT